MTHTLRKSCRVLSAAFSAPTGSAVALGTILSAAIFANPDVASAQRGEGPLVLRLPASARIAALANAGLVSTDGDALFYNPGMLASIRGSAASVQSYGASATTGSMATTSTAGSLTVGIGAQFLTYRAPAGMGYAEVVKFGATHLPDGGAVHASSTAFTVGLARTIKGLRLGVAAKYAEDRLGPVSDGTVAVDIGMNRSMGPGTLGVVVQNLGPGLRLDGVKGALPRRVGVGYGGYQAIAGHWDIGAQMALTWEGDSFVRTAGGAELAYVPIDGVAITLRQGFRLPRERDESLVTAGIGVTVDRVAVDYAMDPVRGGRAVSHRIGVRIR